MQRTIIIVALSFVAGSGVTYTLFSSAIRAPEHAGAPPSQLAPTPNVALDSRNAHPPAAPAIAERARVYQLVANARADELEIMALDILTGNELSQQSFELDAIMARLIEIDPDAALAFARDHDLGAARELDVAVSVLDSIGYSQQAIDSILAALPGLNRDQFLARALENLAAVDPRRALATVLAELTNAGPLSPAFGFVDGGNSQTLLRVASVWAGNDPDSALAAIDTIGDMRARYMFAQVVLGRVAQSDPDAVLTYVDRMDVPEQEKMAFVRNAILQLAARDPQRAVEYAETFSGRNGQMALMMAVQQWAQRDARAAAEYVQGLPGGMMRQNLLQQVAAGYGRSDPDAALAWAQSLTSGQAEVYAGVLGGIAQTDPLRAMDLTFSESQPGLTSSAQIQALMRVVSTAAAVGGVPHRRIADRILALENGQAREFALQMLGQTWASQDANSALDWFLSNQELTGPNMLGNLAQQFASQDPQSAALYTARMPSDLRGQWISAVASGYAQADPDGARAWVQQFRGEPVYETAVTEIIRYSAGADPANAAVMWASVDFADQATQTQLVSTIAGSWAAQDWPAARNWVSTLPRGEARDSALTGMIGVRQEIPDASVMSLFSDDERRLGAIQNIIMQTAQYDPERARDMVREHFDEPSRREQAEQMIDNIASGQNGTGFMIRGSQGVVPAVGIRESGIPVFVR